MGSQTVSSLVRNSTGGASWCWNDATVRQAAIAFSSSLIPGLMNDAFHASRLETSATLSVVTLTPLTTPTSDWSARTRARIMVSPQSGKKREELLDLFLRRPPPVLADLEGLGVLDLLAVRSIDGLELLAELVRDPREALGEPLADGGLAGVDGRRVLRVGHEVGAAVAAALVELGLQRGHAGEILLGHVVDRHDDVGRERIGPLEVV